MRSKVEAEKAADSNKQIDELKRRLRELEDEKDLIKSQRNHLVTLNEGATLDRSTLEYGNLIGDQNGSKSRTPSAGLRRSLDSLIDASFYTKPVKLELELPCRDEGNVNTSLPLEFPHSATLDYEHEPNSARFVSASRDAHKLKRVFKRERDLRIRENLTHTTGNESTHVQKSSLEPDNTTFGHSVGQDFVNKSNASSRMLRKEFSADSSDKMIFRSTNPEDFQTEKSLLSGRTSDQRGLAREENEKHWQKEKNAARAPQGECFFS